MALSRTVRLFEKKISSNHSIGNILTFFYYRSSHRSYSATSGWRTTSGGHCPDRETDWALDLLDSVQHHQQVDGNPVRRNMVITMFGLNIKYYSPSLQSYYLAVDMRSHLLYFTVGLSLSQNKNWKTLLKDYSHELHLKRVATAKRYRAKNYKILISLQLNCFPQLHVSIARLVNWICLLRFDHFRIILDESIRIFEDKNCHVFGSQHFGKKNSCLKEVISKVQSMGEILYNINFMWGKWTMK